jgi:hypothetical protein
LSVTVDLTFGSRQTSVIEPLRYLSEETGHAVSLGDNDCHGGSPSLNAVRKYTSLAMIPVTGITDPLPAISL